MCAALLSLSDFIQLYQRSPHPLTVNTSFTYLRRMYQHIRQSLRYREDKEYWVLHGLASIRKQNMGIGWDRIEYPGFHVSFFLDDLTGYKIGIFPLIR